MDWAKIPKFLVWRKKNEGLIKGCTSKRNEAGNCGKVASFLLLYHLVKRFVSVSFTRNLVVNYLLNSQKITSRWLCKSKLETANTTQDKMDAVQFSIPPCSPDLIPIENAFSLVDKKIK